MCDQVTYYLKTLLGHTFTYQDEKSYDKVIKFLCDQLKFNPDEVKLIAGGEVLQNDSALPETNSVIHVVKRLKGGASCASSSTDFKSGSEIVKMVQAKPETPNWETIRIGLNVKIQCVNQDSCPTRRYGGRVYVKVGLGTFNMNAAEFQQFECPGCHVISKLPFITVGFAGKCEFIVKGQTSTDETVYQNTCVSDGELIEFKSPIDKTTGYTIWKKLEISVFETFKPSLEISGN